jgi:hypothetical protein
LRLAGKELVFAYHTANHGLSLRAAECTSLLIQETYDKNFHSGKTKTAAIIQKIISPLIDSQVKNVLNSFNFVTVITDTSNRKHEKLLPILVRGFTSTSGVQTFKISVKSIDNETSETITGEIISAGMLILSFELFFS